VERISATGVPECANLGGSASSKKFSDGGRVIEKSDVWLYALDCRSASALNLPRQWNQREFDFSAAGRLLRLEVRERTADWTPRWHVVVAVRVGRATFRGE
jgi:hypothetical protein